MSLPAPAMRRIAATFLVCLLIWSRLDAQQAEASPSFEAARSLVLRVPDIAAGTQTAAPAAWPSRAVTRWRIRSFSSAAALSVKVNATIDRGSSPPAMRSATRWETTSVLPEPAAAMIWMWPPRCATARAASPSRVGMLGSMGLRCHPSPGDAAAVSTRMSGACGILSGLGKDVAH